MHCLQLSHPAHPAVTLQQGNFADTGGLAILAISGAGVTSTAISAAWSTAGAVDLGTIPAEASDFAGGMLLVQFNVNADPAADLTIALALAGPVQSSWFAL